MKSTNSSIEIYRLCSRIKFIQNGPGVNGRPSIVPKALKLDLKNEALSRDLSKNSFTLQSFDKQLKILRREYALKEGKNPDGLEKLTKSTMENLIKSVVPEILPRISTQNERRFESITNILNHASLAATWPAVINYDGDDYIPSCRQFNFDSTSIMLASSVNERRRLLLAEGSKATLKGLGFSPATTTTRADDNYKRRCVALTALTRADGHLCCVIVKVKDYVYKKTRIHKVR
jgi:hypothetical protein